MPDPQEESVARGHEVSTLNVRQVVIALLSLIALIGITFMGMVELMEFYSAEAYSDRKSVANQFENSTPIEVSSLYVDQSAELQQRLTRQRTFLDSFGPIDNEEAFLRIPIADAMKIFAEESTEFSSGESSTEDSPDE